MGAATKWTKTETIRRVRKAGVMVRRHAGAAANTTVEVGQWTVEQVMPEMATEEHWATWHATQSEGDLFDFLTDWSSIGTDDHCRTIGAVVAIYVYDRSDGGEGLLNTYDVWLGNADSAPDRAASDAAVLRLAGLFKG